MSGKLKWAYAAGLQMKESGFELPGMEPVDFTGTLNVPATTGTQRFVLLALPAIQTAAVQLGAIEGYLNPLAAATGSRAIGQFANPIGICAGLTIFSATGAGAVVAYAATLTLQITVLAMGTGVGVATNLLTAAFAMNGLTTPAQVLALTSIPTDRQVIGPNAAVLSNMFYLFPGDVVTAFFSNTGAAAVTVAAGNVLGIGFEIF